MMIDGLIVDVPDPAAPLSSFSAVFTSTHA